jgi:hypothetical protein
MMRNILIIAVLGILITSSGTIMLAHPDDGVLKKVETLAFSAPFFEDKGEFISVKVENANSVLLEPGNPILPAYKETLTFPFGTNIKEIKCNILSEINNEILQKSLPLAPEPTYSGYSDQVNILNKNLQTSGQGNIFPDRWFEYTLGCGLKDGERVLFLTLQFYPVRYSYDNTISYISNAEVEIIYEESTTSNAILDEYDLLVIAPDVFSNDLQRLVDHKESHDIKTKLVSLSEIYDGSYFPVNGRDDAEKVKYFIKDSFDNWGIKYVLLVGGRKPGIKETWYMPVRYVDVFWEGEIRYVSDLYYADLYNATYEFSSWDTDGNGVFGEWPQVGTLKDKMDLYPDVYVGRWACKNKFEVKTMVDKTIKYENNAANKKIVVSGGDNFEDAGYEGEIVADKALTYFPEFDAKKIYASQTDVTAKNLRKALGTGAIFMYLHGHGSPNMWTTHKPNNFDVWEDGIGVSDLPLFFNREYPIVLVGGCHNAMFNISIFNHPWTPAPVPEDLCWWFAKKYMGGGIASLGYTCFPVATPGEYGDLDGDGINEPDCVESGYGYMELGLLYKYGVEGNQNLGDCWGYAVSRYIEHFITPLERYNIHTIHGFVLLGDPSLKIGGY